MEQAYARHLAEIHARLSTPAEVVDRVLRRVTSAAIVSRRRIVEGEANEVYGIEVVGRAPLIVRISRDKDKHFEQERWAIERCAALGVPAPKMLWIEHLSSETGPLDICIQEKLPGRVLTPETIAATAREDLKAIMVQLGDHLSRLHAIRVDGIGYLDSAGRGAPPTAATEWSADDERSFLDVAERVGFDHGMMRDILDITARGVAPVVEPRLVHNDMRARHVMASDDRITGIIDWGEVSGDEPITDLVHWDYWDGERLPLDWLKQGYRDATLFGGDFGERLRLGRFVYGLCVLRWYAQRGFRAGVEAAMAKLTVDLDGTKRRI